MIIEIRGKEMAMTFVENAVKIDKKVEVERTSTGGRGFIRRNYFVITRCTVDIYNI